MGKTCFAAFALLATTVAWADPPKEVMDIKRDADLKWNPSKVVPGIQQAVIAGNPADPGKVYVGATASRPARSACRTSIPRRATSRC